MKSYAKEIAKYDWHGYTPWGNYGDGKWRIMSPHGTANVIEPATTLRVAHKRLLEYLGI